MQEDVTVHSVWSKLDRSVILSTQNKDGGEDSYFRKRRLANICSCEMHDSDAVKCDLLYAHEASFSIKLLCEMRIIAVKLLDYDLIVQIRAKIL